MALARRICVIRTNSSLSSPDRVGRLREGKVKVRQTPTAMGTESGLQSDTKDLKPVSLELEELGKSSSSYASKADALMRSWQTETLRRK